MEVPPRQPRTSSWLLLILAPYLISFALPAVCMTGRTQQTTGFEAMYMMVTEGMYGVILAPFALGPNFAFCVGLCCLYGRAWKAATVFGVVASVGAAFVGWMALFEWAPSPGMSLGAGFYLWLASMAAVTTAGLARQLKRSIPRPPAESSALPR